MLQIGYSITQPNDKLEKIDIETLVAKIKSTEGKLFEMIQQLRNIILIDKNSYSKFKVRLPYIVCGYFNPPYRKKENFSHVEYFIVDIDHASSANRSINEIKEKIKVDEEVLVAFTSPGNDGLKIIFRLSEPCYDEGKYKLFYNEFVMQFAQRYELQGLIDPRTNDVTRACFLSHDTEIIHNPQALSIDIEPYIQNKSFSDELPDELEEIFIDTTKKENPLDDDKLEEIKRKLNLTSKVAKQKEKNIYSPPEIDRILPLIVEKLNEFEINVKAFQNINYGKKIIVELGLKWAEVNVFYGKRGYTVVKSPKNGSNQDLCDVTYKIVLSVLNNL